MKYLNNLNDLNVTRTHMYFTYDQNEEEKREITAKLTRFILTNGKLQKLFNIKQNI